MADAPKIFGRAMVLQEVPGPRLYVLSQDDFCVAIWQYEGTWMASVDGSLGNFNDTRGYASAEEAAAVLEHRLFDAATELFLLLDEGRKSRLKGL